MGRQGEGAGRRHEQGRRSRGVQEDGRGVAGWQGEDRGAGKVRGR